MKIPLFDGRDFLSTHRSRRRHRQRNLRQSFLPG
jgi:hypothetical protein